MREHREQIQKAKEDKLKYEKDFLSVVQKELDEDKEVKIKGKNTLRNEFLFYNDRI